MSFLALVIALLLHKVTDADNASLRYNWLASWQRQVMGWELGPVLRLLVFLLPVVVLCNAIFNVLAPLLFGLLWIALAVAILVYALGPGDFQQRMAHYQNHCRSENFESAYLDAVAYSGATRVAGELESPQAMHRHLQQQFYYQAYQGWFAVVFYFMLLGPAGALGYRMLQQYQRVSGDGLALRCLFVLDWVPARLLAATFALVGNFVGSRDTLFSRMGEVSAEPAAILDAVGSAALEVPVAAGVSFGDIAASENEALEKLLSRSAISWLIVISLAVLLD